MENEVIKNLSPVEFANQRVILTKQLVEVYKCTESRIRDNFHTAKAQFEEGVHYFKLTGEALRQLKRDVRISDAALVGKSTTVLYLWTEQGAILHCKMINSNEAWKVLKDLVAFYFAHKAAAPAAQSLFPDVPPATSAITTQPETKVIAAVNLVEMQNQIDELKVAFQAVQTAFEETAAALREQVTKLERAEKLLEVAKLMEPSPEKQKLLLQAANLIAGKKLF